MIRAMAEWAGWTLATNGLFISSVVYFVLFMEFVSLYGIRVGDTIRVGPDLVGALAPTLCQDPSAPSIGPFYVTASTRPFRIGGFGVLLIA